MRNNKPFKIMLAFIFIVVLLWNIITLYQKEQNEITKIETESVAVKAIIDYASRSGNRANVFTIMGVQYMVDGESFYGTIKRHGYKDGKYTQGDTILIYINPETKKINK